MALTGSMALMPEWARRLTATDVPERQRAFVLASMRARVKLVRWAYPELPCRAIALARAEGRPAATRN
jgi:hypothetical protein